MVEQSFERLYLAKNCEDSKKDIYVDRCPIVQHQLNGIRFLYRAWHKKKPGVILNDPSGYGKRVQTALFLSAVLPTLAKSVLILCREGSEQQWMSYFSGWTKITDDVAMELTNPFAKKKVLISATYAAAVFAKRDWSVLVVDHDLISNDILKSTLKADLVIWITSAAMKEELPKFSSFYSWVYRKAKFDADKYKANKSDLNDVLEKTAMLDGFFEDIVLRRNCGVTPFPKSQISITKSNSIEETKTSTVTKKNKDVTGTKIKRSKRTSVETATENVPNKVAKTSAENNTKVFDIDAFKDKPTKADKSTTRNPDGDLDDINVLSDEEDFAPLTRKSKKSGLWDNESDDEQVDKTKSRTDEIDTKEDNGSFSVNDDNQIELLHKIYNNEIMDKINPVNNNKFSEDLFSTDLTINNEMDLKEVQRIENGLTKTLKQDEIIEKSKAPENANLSSFDLKMKELEERTLKKYKGSFLDSIF